MAYFKIMIRSGHWGTGKDFCNSCYVRADDIVVAFSIARKFPAFHHDQIPFKAHPISEDEYIINSAVKRIERAYHNKIVPLSYQEIEKTILHQIEIEKSKNPDYREGKLVAKLKLLCKQCADAVNSKEQRLNAEELSKWIIENYQNQEKILENDEKEI